MLERYASHAALAMMNASLLEKVQRMASTDGLTMIANRRTFDESLQREINRVSRGGEPLSLIMLDLDRFKVLNDTYGHQKGDDVLHKVARVLEDECRDFDTVARYGGEEFGIDPSRHRRHGSRIGRPAPCRRDKELLRGHDDHGEHGRCLVPGQCR